MSHSPILTDLSVIAGIAAEKEEENRHFLSSLKRIPDAELDAQVHRLNETVSAAIDCTDCGNCCRTLVINVEPGDLKGLAAFLGQSEEEARGRYIEESMGGRCFVNAVPCHFLEGSRCSVYEHRFSACRDFPSLHKPGFRERFPGTLGYYDRCPIIFNVVEQLKGELGFLL